MGNQKSGIYRIRCNRTGKFYVGSSKQIYVRWYEHRRSLRRGASGCVRLQRAWNKHGEECFQFSILEECSVDELEAREQFYVSTLKPDYNIIVDISRRLSPETLAKRAASLRARAALITHCPRGHPYDEANTYRNKQGKRICRDCNALRVQSVYASESPEQREWRRQRSRANHINNRETRLAKMKEYVLAHKTEKAKYDRERRLRLKAN
jgi:group I intron endonuclease